MPPSPALERVSLVVLAQDLSDTVSLPSDYALGKDCIMHGFMLKLGNPFLTQWQRRYFYLFPNRLEWRGEGDSRVSSGGGGPVQLWGSAAPTHCLLPVSLCQRNKGCCGLTFKCPCQVPSWNEMLVSFERWSPKSSSLRELSGGWRGEWWDGRRAEQERRSQLLALRT